MKHAVLLFLLVVVCYAMWHVAPKPERKRITGFLLKHGVRAVLLLLCLFLLLGTAVQRSSINLF